MKIKQSALSVAVAHLVLVRPMQLHAMAASVSLSAGEPHSGRPGIVVCGVEAGVRMCNFALTLVDPPPIYFRHTTEILIDALKAWQHPLCIIEHAITFMDLNQGPDGMRATAFPSLPEQRTIYAYDIIPRLVPLSPETHYLVTSHTRGFGIGSDRPKYKAIPQVLRATGFLNSESTRNFLLRYVQKHWNSRKKTEEEFSRDFDARFEANSRLAEEWRERRERREQEEA